MTPKKNATTNWLATPSEDFGKVLAGKLAEYAGETIGPGATLHYNNVAIAYTHLYGLDVEGVGANASLVTRSGPNGSVAELRVPAAAGDLAKAWNIVVGPELTWSAVPSTTDSASEAEAINARNALHYVWEQENVGAVAKRCAFYAMGLAESAMHVPWDKTKGEIVGIDESDPENPKPVHSGDWDFRPVDTWDLIRDPSARSYDASPWVIVREWQNKFDLAAACEDPEAAEACVSAQWTPPLSGQVWVPWQSTWSLQSDLIPVYYLYCRLTPSVPTGRQTVFLSDGTLLEDGPLDEAYHKQLPVARMAAGEYRGSPWPYTKFFGALGAQQASDALLKDLLTNATAVSGPIITVDDANMDGGMAIGTMGGGPQILPIPKESREPKVLQVQSSHPEHFNLNNRLRSDIQQILGIDNITAGQDVGKNLSGAAMALLTSTSVQNNSQLQATWTEFVQTIGTIVLKHLQYHVKTPKRMALAGEARSGLVTLAEVGGAQVRGIERVLVSIGSALQQTDAGKYEIATTALKEGWAKTPEQFQTVLDTGRLDALTQDLSNELILIGQENEALSKGQDVPVMVGDDHSLHLRSHRFVTANIAVRLKPEVVAALQAHQQLHLDALMNTDPAVLQLFGQPALGALGAPPGPPGGGGGPPGAPPEMGPSQPGMPSMPKNPASGEVAGPVAGSTPPAMLPSGGSK